MAFTVTADPKRFNEAADYFLKLSVLTKEEAQRLGSEASRRAFWIGGGLHLSQVQRVFDRVADAIEQQIPFDEWRQSVKSELRSDHHAETVFRNATQRSLNAGRWRQMNEPGVAAARPFVLFDGIADSRQSQICRECDGTIVPLGHPWLATHSPLLHHRCRSSLRNLRASDAQRRGITNVPPQVEADDGFGLSPDAEPEWKPDPAKHDPELLKTLGAKQGKRPKVTPPPPAEAPREHDPKHWEAHYAEKYGEAAPTVAWGRAMAERGLDRSAGDVLAELERLRKAGHPTLTSADGEAAIAALQALDPNRPLRDTFAAARHKHFIALSEHTRTIKPGEAMKLAGPSALPKSTKAFYDLTLDKGVRRPNDWRIQRIDGRSSASAGSRLIRMRRTAGDEIWTHEIAHAIEHANVRAEKRSKAFLAARTKGEKLQQIPGHAPGEVGRPDKFTAPYVGRDYGTGGTEVTSMGYQWLHEGSSDTRKLVEHDEDHVLFLLGQLAGR